MFCSCLARMSSPPTPRSSSASPAAAARERAPIASPGSPPNTAPEAPRGGFPPLPPATAPSGTPAPPEPRAAAPISSTSNFPPRPQTGQQRGCGASASSKTAAPDGAPLRRQTPERLGGLFRLAIDAKAGFEMKHDPTIRAPTKSTASCRSISSPQRTDGVLLKPSYFAAIGHCLQEAVFDDGRRRYVDYARNSGHCFCAIPWRIQNPGEPCACPQVVGR